MGNLPERITAADRLDEHLTLQPHLVDRILRQLLVVLHERGIPDQRIWVTLERHMDCGVGLCGHCQLGRFFVCKDGPVFSLAELGPAFDVEGL